MDIWGCSKESIEGISNIKTRWDDDTHLVESGNEESRGHNILGCNWTGFGKVVLNLRYFWDLSLGSSKMNLECLDKSGLDREVLT